ncbi:hypothetical protein AURDEDRAFT_127989 [Auricularia subglabra TFB-10046 SS5]|nr:hypothetical protein AURDEDRAFT_127989 [Auricularia subglabra TFB-10046 SS5]
MSYNSEQDSARSRSAHAENTRVQRGGHPSGQTGIALGSPTRGRDRSPPPNIDTEIIPHTPSRSRTTAPSTPTDAFRYMSLVDSNPPSPTKRSASPTKRSASPTKHVNVFSAPTTALMPPAASPRTPRPVTTPAGLRPTPGGVPSTQRVARVTIPAGLEHPNQPPGQLLTYKVASDWVRDREANGLQTSLADHAAARARQNDFIVSLCDRTAVGDLLFHPLYERDSQIRNMLFPRLVRDLKRALYTLEVQTDALVLAFVVSPHHNPNTLERLDERDNTIVRVGDANTISFKYAHVPITHRRGAGVHEDWYQVHEDLKGAIIDQFAKPHVEWWGRRRKAAGHAGTLGGSRQPYAADDSSSGGDEAAVEDEYLPELPGLIERVAPAPVHQLSLVATLVNLKLGDALTVLLEDKMDPLTALALLSAKVRDEQAGFPIEHIAHAPMGRVLRKLSALTPRPKGARVKRNASKRRLSKENNKLYDAYIQEAHAQIRQLIKEGAKKFNNCRRDEGTVRNHVFTKTRLSPAGEQLWQAYVHYRSKEINEGLPLGHHKLLGEIHAIIDKDPVHYKDRPKEEQAEWLRMLKEDNADRDVQKRRNRKGEEVDHAHTINQMAHEARTRSRSLQMEAAEMRYGLQSFFMAVRSDAQQHINPVILCSDEVKEFIALFLGKTPEQIARMFELWAVNGADGVLGPLDRKTANQLRSEIRQFIQMRLKEPTHVRSDKGQKRASYKKRASKNAAAAKENVASAKKAAVKKAAGAKKAAAKKASGSATA